MKLLVLESLLVLGLSAGDHQPGEGCTENSQCTEGYKCLLQRELNYYRCAEEAKPTPAPSENTPQKMPEDKSPNPFNQILDTIAQLFPFSQN